MASLEQLSIPQIIKKDLTLQKARDGALVHQHHIDGDMQPRSNQ